MSSQGEIPQSSALAETGSDSLTEVMSRDPEGYSRQDRDRIVEALRAQRARLAAVEEAGGKPRAPRSSTPKLPLSSTSAKPIEDMGL